MKPIATALAALLLMAQAPAPSPGPSPGPSPAPVRIGVLEDMSTGMADTFGAGEVAAAELAIADDGAATGRTVELLQADHQSKPDVAAGIARRWFDAEHVDMITGLANSAIGIGVQGLARERNRISIITGSGSTDITGKQCSPTGAHWVIDTYALARTVAQPLVASPPAGKGLKDWFFIVADITLGKSLVADVTPVIAAGGGRVVGQVNHPLLATDFADQLLRARASKAQVIALMNVGADAVNAVKQASEFGISSGTGGQALAGLYMSMTDVHALGLPVAQGIYLAEAYYWDTDDATRAFARRYAAKMGGRMPNSYQAGVYSAVAHYLKAVAKAGTAEAGPVMAAMRDLKVNDFMTHDGVLRPDGRLVRDVTLFQAKTPAESHGEWDLLRPVSTVPGAEAFRPLAQSECPGIKP